MPTQSARLRRHPGPETLENLRRKETQAVLGGLPRQDRAESGITPPTPIFCKGASFHHRRESRDQPIGNGITGGTRTGIHGGLFAGGVQATARTVEMLTHAQEGWYANGLGLGVCVGHHNIAPGPTLRHGPINRLCIIPGFRHGLTVQVKALARGLVALDVHQEWPSVAGHLQRRLQTRTGTIGGGGVR
jgi:hypothetical protein